MPPTALRNHPVLGLVGKQVVTFRMLLPTSTKQSDLPTHITARSLLSNPPGTPSTGMLSQGVHAADSTRDYFVPNHPANSHIHATNVTKAIQGVNVNTLPTFHPCLQHSNPLPTLVSITININNFLINHPNQALVGYVVNGLYNGFNIGFFGNHQPTKPKNLKSAGENENGIDAAIDKELAWGHTCGPFRYPSIVDLHCLPIGGIVKKDGSCRLIMDLSQPMGCSINEHISKEEFTVQYSHFDEATELVRRAGRHCLMSKVDIKHAFRLLPVRLEDWKLLGYFWKHCYFIDTRLPFGLRSSPAIFNCFADLTCWVIHHVCHLRSLVHYADELFLSQ